VTDRSKHSKEVEAFLKRAFGGDWVLSLPRGTGHETYIAHNGSRTLFVKLGASIERVLAMAALGLTPDVLEVGHAAEGTTILVQLYIEGRNPTRQDYRGRLEQVAGVIREMHNSAEVKASLPATQSDDYARTGLHVLSDVRLRWEAVREQLPGITPLVDQGLDDLEQTIAGFKGSGLIASHGDICNANWLITPEGRLYLVDLDAMTLDDPALDTGATLWWYYPLEMWEPFLEAAGYENTEEFQERMWVRLALHCLSITLPRPGSFDVFEPAHYAQSLVDFQAALYKQGNPQG
jgi:aminoglycoside phosphotransferase (APT) family kinase protein